MSSMQTPLHRVQGMGASHSGTGHFWRERVSSAALVPLTLWFAYAVIGLAGATEVTAVQFLGRPWNIILMAAFVITSLYHLRLGVQVVIDDYVHTAGMKILLMLLALLFVLGVGGFSLFALVRIAQV